MSRIRRSWGSVGLAVTSAPIRGASAEQLLRRHPVFPAHTHISVWNAKTADRDRGEYHDQRHEVAGAVPGRRDDGPAPITAATKKARSVQALSDSAQSSGPVPGSSRTPRYVMSVGWGACLWLPSGSGCAHPVRRASGSSGTAVSVAMTSSTYPGSADATGTASGVACASWVWPSAAAGRRREVSCCGTTGHVGVLMIDCWERGAGPLAVCGSAAMISARALQADSSPARETGERVRTAPFVFGERDHRLAHLRVVTGLLR